MARMCTAAPFHAAVNAAGTPRSRRETNFELTWNTPANGWLTLRPDLQYVMHQGADPLLKDAVITGLRFDRSWAAAGG